MNIHSVPRLTSDIEMLVSTIDSCDIELLLNSYDCDSHNLRFVHDYLADRIRNHAPPYGLYMTDHLEWTGDVFGEILTAMGYNERIVRNAVFESKLHDVGKTSLEGRYSLTENRQQKDPSEKETLTKLHTVLGPLELEKALMLFPVHLTDDDVLSNTAKKLFMIFHHERMNGTGPHQRTDMHPVLRAHQIADAFHGKMKAHNAEAVIEQMRGESKGDKHHGEFDLEILTLAKPILLARTPQIIPVKDYLTRASAPTKNLASPAIS